MLVNSFRFLVIGLSLLINASLGLADKHIALTLDDSPRFASGYFDGPTRAKTLLEQLKKHQVKQVAFFSNSQKLNEEGIQRLSTYSEAGHIIANHTHSHPDINQQTLAEFRQDFELAHQTLRSFKTFKPWFRFPFLREGDTLEKRDGMRVLMEEEGYFNAYITINNYDWYIEHLFQQSIKQGDRVNLDKLRDFYVSVMMASIEYYDQMAQKHINRSPKHVLLLHEMDITALFIGDLITALRESGWDIINPEDAYTDKIAEYQTPSLFTYNPGRIGEIARDNGQKKGLWHYTLNEKYLQEQFNQQVLSDNSDQ